MALNLVGGKELAWQERKAASFTASRLHCGNWQLGYRPSERYGGSQKIAWHKPAGPSDHAISLGTAIAISGAAASPNMGYHSSPIVALLMTIFNARLGWWLGNPGKAGERSWRFAGPRFALKPLLAEASGSTTDEYPYIHLSDGGHFENLGIYEMVLRRNRFIVAVDASADDQFQFEDLGNAIRKIRIDLGITIDVQVSSFREKGGATVRCAYGKIEYWRIDNDSVEDAGMPVTCSMSSPGFAVKNRPTLPTTRPPILNFRTNRRPISFSASRNSRAIACWAATPWTASAPPTSGPFPNSSRRSRATISRWQRINQTSGWVKRTAFGAERDQRDQLSVI